MTDIVNMSANDFTMIRKVKFHHQQRNNIKAILQVYQSIRLSCVISSLQSCKNNSTTNDKLLVKTNKVSKKLKKRF